jgi:hypothetical protein
MKTKPIIYANYTILDGDAGIYETVNYMWNYALRDVDEPLVKDLVSSLKGSNKLETIRNIYDWVWQNVSYKLDPVGYEMITSPIHFVNGNRTTGDCDCMTTLLVCMLESCGFDCGITVISWRVPEYTHVFAEVIYNNKWFILDPTLKENGFGFQDKKIKRYRRITKKDMAKLQVLADGSAETSRRLFRNRSRCYGNDDWNRNSNNININFGTNVENAHNSSNSNTDGGRSVSNNDLPGMNNIYDYHSRQPAKIGSPVILRPNGKGFYEVDNSSNGGIIRTEQRISKPSMITKKGVIDNKRPKFVPNSSKNYYQEFP